MDIHATAGSGRSLLRPAAALLACLLTLPVASAATPTNRFGLPPLNALDAQAASLRGVLR